MRSASFSSLQTVICLLEPPPEPFDDEHAATPESRASATLAATNTCSNQALGLGIGTIIDELLTE